MTGPRYELRLATDDVERLRSLLTIHPNRESAAFLLAGESRFGDMVRLVVRRAVEIPSAEYRVRTGDHIHLSPRAINGLVALCEASRLRPILCHSHPTDVPYSPSDDYGEARIAKTLQAFFSGRVMGSVLLTPTGFRGRIWVSADEFQPIKAITSVGRALKRLVAADGPDSTLSAASAGVYDRQVRALGRAGQVLIEATRVGIVGVGGTGSPLAEQLVRLGVRDLLLIDRDEVVELSNLSRVYGTRSADVQRKWWDRLIKKVPKSKVSVVAEHLRAISPQAAIRSYRGDVTDVETVHLLLDRDVLFACTDNHWSRAVLNQIAYQYLIPVVNLGLAIDGSEGTIRGAAGGVQVLRPGLGCLWCSDYLNSDRIRAESLPLDVRSELQAEGYLRGLPEAVPSVVTMTTTIAGLAGTVFLQLVTDFMGDAGEISRINYFPLEAIAARGRVPVRTPCLCSKVKGRGDLEPLPVVPARVGHRRRRPRRLGSVGEELPE